MDPTLTPEKTNSPINTNPQPESFLPPEKKLQTTLPIPSKKPKLKTLLIILVGLVIFIGLTGLIFFLKNYLKPQFSEPLPQPTVLPTPIASPSPNVNLLNWKEYKVENAHLIFKTPFELNVEINDKKYGLSEFYIQDYPINAPPPDNYYQLYANYSWYPPTTNELFQKKVAELTTKTKITVGNYEGFKGQITINGKKKDIIIFLKENGIFAIYTYPINQKNKDLTDSIFQTFEFTN